MPTSVGYADAVPFVALAVFLILLHLWSPTSE